MDPSELDTDTMKDLAEFLTQCQENTKAFDYEHNYCIQGVKPNPFVKGEASSTIGYSETLYKFLYIEDMPLTKDNTHVEAVELVKQQKYSLTFIDSFVMKKANDATKKKEAEEFMKYMQSDEVVEIYTGGKYLEKQETTYLLPPTKSVFQKVMKNDTWYKDFGKTFFDDSKVQVPFVIDGFV